MEASVAIDPKSGNVSVGALLITPQLQAQELSDAFSIAPERPAMVLGRSVPCQFATAEVVNEGQHMRIELRFENTVLVSCFFTFPGAEAGREHHTCSVWLNGQIGFGGGLARFPWGSAGVATDRSGNSHVFIHNKNNSWAHCGVSA